MDTKAFLIDHLLNPPSQDFIKEATTSLPTNDLLLLALSPPHLVEPSILAAAQECIEALKSKKHHSLKVHTDQSTYKLQAHASYSSNSYIYLTIQATHSAIDLGTRVPHPSCIFTYFIKPNNPDSYTTHPFNNTTIEIDHRHFKLKARLKNVIQQNDYKIYVLNIDAMIRPIRPSQETQNRYPRIRLLGSVGIYQNTPNTLFEFHPDHYKVAYC